MYLLVISHGQKKLLNGSDHRFSLISLAVLKDLWNKTTSEKSLHGLPLH